jgi:hypothetical protein
MRTELFGALPRFELKGRRRYRDGERDGDGEEDEWRWRYLR